MNLGGGLNRPRPSETDPPAFLHCTTPPLLHDLDLVGPIELQLDATCTAPDTAFIAVLQDVDDHGNSTNVTAGYLRASLRRVDEVASKPGIPVLPCRTFEAVPIGERVAYRIPLVSNAGDFGLVIRSVYISQRMTKARTAPRYLSSDMPRSVPVPSIPFCPHRDCFCVWWDKRLLWMMESANYPNLIQTTGIPSGCREPWM